VRRGKVILSVPADAQHLVSHTFNRLAAPAVGDAEKLYRVSFLDYMSEILRPIRRMYVMICREARCVNSKSFGKQTVIYNNCHRTWDDITVFVFYVSELGQTNLL
jgi:hypothetical protein